MTTELSIHHVGEVVLKGLLEGLARADRLDAAPCKLHSGCSLRSVLRAAEVEPPYSFSVNAKLASVDLDGEAVGFDGAHGVDVLCHHGGRGLPIEAKLGIDRLSGSTFTARFLKPPTMSKHTPPRCNGGMTAILNYRSIGKRGPLPLRTSKPPTELTPAWLLVVRAKTWKQWPTECPELSNAHVAVFEDIAKAFGDSAAFDRLVLQQVGDGFHSAWKVFS